jgi:Putative peptidoglycan binding domain
VDRVKPAESDLEAASQDITDQTPTREATENHTSAAFALEVAWLNLFADAGCLTDKQSKQAAALSEYTVAMQSDLKTAGYLQGAVDGIYGPETVQAVEDLQTDAGLPVTGLVDQATRDALEDAFAQKGQSAATNEAIEAASVQTMLKLAGYWPGAIDGKWTPEARGGAEAVPEGSRRRAHRERRCGDACRA